MAKVLWIGDAGTTTGFGQVSSAIGERLVDMGHEVHALAVAYQAAEPYEGRLKLYRAEAGKGRNYLGYDRTAELVKRLEPDIVICNEDAPMTLKRLIENKYDPDNLLLKSQPIVSYMPVDGYGFPKAWEQLKSLATIVPYTKFGARMWDVPHWVYHGTDPAFHRMDDDQRREIRDQFKIPHDAFVVGRVDTNSGRKDWGSTWRVIQRAFDMGLSSDADKTVALFHTTLSDPRSGVDFPSLISRGKGKFIITGEQGWPVEQLNQLFNVFDVYLTTSRGEGWGLSVAQALACGVPVIATDCSSMPEVVGPGGWLISGAAVLTNPYGIDLVVADTEKMAKRLLSVSHDPELRRKTGDRGMAHVKQFTWDDAAATFNDIINGLVAQT